MGPTNKKNSSVANTQVPNGTGEAAASAKRDPKFSQNELSALVNSVLENYKLLFGDLSNEITHEKKMATWAIVAETVSAASSSGTLRTAEKVQVKFTHWKSETKKKAAKLYHARIRTGGGNENLDAVQKEEIFATMYSMSANEKKLVGLLGVEAVVGFNDGIDSFQSTNSEVISPSIVIENSQTAIIPFSADRNTHDVPSSTSATAPPVQTPLIKLGEKRKSKTKDDDTIPEKILKGQAEILAGVKEISAVLREILEVQKERLNVERAQLNLN